RYARSDQPTKTTPTDRPRAIQTRRMRRQICRRFIISQSEFVLHATVESSAANNFSGNPASSTPPIVWRTHERISDARTRMDSALEGAKVANDGVQQDEPDNDRDQKHDARYAVERHIHRAAPGECTSETN